MRTPTRGPYSVRSKGSRLYNAQETGRQLVESANPGEVSHTIAYIAMK